MPVTRSKREEFREHLRVETIGFLGGFGDDSEFVGVREHDLVDERFDEFDEPEIASGRFNDDTTGQKLLNELNDFVGLIAIKGLPRLHDELLFHYANCDNLLVEVRSTPMNFIKTPRLE
jgi:hypothetical protein